MTLLRTIRSIRNHTKDHRFAYQSNNGQLGWRLGEIFARMGDLGLTAFGGPPVHFQILYNRFVEGRGGKTKWIDEQTYQELFAICQALPGPASTKMVFCIGLIHAGLAPAIFAFFLWSLPGAIGMYGLSLGVQHMPERLPSAAYALLSGMNASTVGIIALAAIQLSEKAITDKVTRILVIFGGCAGICYNSLWFFPILILSGGLTTCSWDLYLKSAFRRFHTRLSQRKRRTVVDAAPTLGEATDVPLQNRRAASDHDAIQRRTRGVPAPGSATNTHSKSVPQRTQSWQATDLTHEDSTIETDTRTYRVPVRVGVMIVVLFFASFIAVMTVRGAVAARPLAFDLFAKMYLAGTVIFGGGPVVIPLLRAYVVEPGWVAPRDFLIGLAVIQAFPGPNFNFSVYLGALTFSHIHAPTIAGSLIGYVAMFLPGLLLALGVQALWSVLRTKVWVISILRGVNATAVGLVFTAVYRLWEIGLLTPTSTNGQSLAKEPWWVVIAAVTFAESAWFRVPPPVAIILGAILGLGWYGVV